jgi:hypothetical protein
MSKDTNTVEWDLVGDQIQRSHKGKDLVVGTFIDGRLEFEDKDAEKKYRTGAITYIETASESGGLGMGVKSFGIKGEEDAQKEDEPVMPKENPTLGDMTPAVVAFYAKHRPKEFVIRYGVTLDSKGKYQRVCCRRERWDLIKTNPKESDVKEFVKSWEVLQNMILARRATQLTASLETVINEDEFNSYAENSATGDRFSASQQSVSED